MLCPGADVFLGDLTTDFCERHFRNLKQKQTTLKAITDSEARCDMINDYRTRNFINTGLSKTSKKTEKISRGNCQISENDRNEYNQDNLVIVKRRKRRAASTLAGNSIPVGINISMIGR